VFAVEARGIPDEVKSEPWGFIAVRIPRKAQNVAFSERADCGGESLAHP
jgi:hypothetical protein